LFGIFPIMKNVSTSPTALLNHRSSQICADFSEEIGVDLRKSAVLQATSALAKKTEIVSKA
jgi:hypothetical protein